MSVIKNSIIYLSSSILSKSIPFLLLPIITRYLSPEEYGTLSIYLIMVSIYSALIGMNIHANISKNFHKVSKDSLSTYIGNILMILSLTFSIYLSLTYLMTFYVNSIFSIPSKWLLLIPFISVMMMMNEINITILRNEQRAYMFGIFEVSNTFIKMFLTVLFLTVFSLGWYAQVLGMTIGSMVFFIVGLIYMKKREYISMNVDIEKMKSILHISIPLIPHVLGGIVIIMSDRLFIEHMVSLEMVGIYSVGYMFGMIVMLFTDAFIKAWSPWFYKSLVHPSNDQKQIIVKYTYFYIISIFIFAIIVSIIGGFVLPYFVDPRFYGAQEFILWIALGYAVRGAYQIYLPYLVHISKTSFLAISTVTAAVINLFLNYFLIKHFGTIGAAYATFIAFLIAALMVFWYQQKNYKMPWFLWKVRND